MGLDKIHKEVRDKKAVELYSKLLELDFHKNPQILNGISEDTVRRGRNKLLVAGQADDLLMEKKQDGEYKIQIFSNPKAEEQLQESIFGSLLEDTNKKITEILLENDSNYLAKLSSYIQSLKHLDQIKRGAGEGVAFNGCLQTIKHLLPEDELKSAGTGIQAALRRATLEQREKDLAKQQNTEGKSTDTDKTISQQVAKGASWAKRARDPAQDESDKRQSKRPLSNSI